MKSSSAGLSASKSAKLRLELPPIIRKASGNGRLFFAEILPPYAYTLRMNYWLVKSEPAAYAWPQFLKDGRTAWTGVRNFQARNNLRAMKKGDAVLFYHSVTGKEVVGLARVAKEFYPDATAREGDWSGVDLVPEKTFSRPVTLEIIKADGILKAMALVKQSRLSVTPVTPAQFDRMQQLAAD